MTWTHHFLKFADEQTALDALAAAYGGAKQSHVHYVRVLGVLMNAEGEPRDGYHLNLSVKGDVPEGLQAFLIEKPQNPAEVMAGSA
jgi:hypothetical protein